MTRAGLSRRRRPLVAIDGPAGAGKSSVSREVARRLGYTLLDTGALYRGVAWAAHEAGVAWSNAEELGQLAERIDLDFEIDAGGDPQLTIDGTNRESEIRSPEISRAASIVSRHPPVRAALLARQRYLGRDGGVVLEGRDIGTVVFPDAETKIFLTASAQERARRRTLELQDRGITTDSASTLQEIQERDARDESREVAPLEAAHDAVVVDSTGLDLEEVVQRVLEIVHASGPAGSDQSGT